MNRKVSGFSTLLLGIVVGCGGSTGGGRRYPDASVFLDASGIETAKADVGADVPLEPPKPGANSHLVVSGSAELIGSGSNSCTNQLGATGDRWCAFALPSTTLGRSDLWVINATQAAAGTKVRCDGVDPNCIRLTRDLFIDADIGFSIHGFDGDTLIYYAETAPNATANTGFIGFVYGWRPGWIGGRKLSSESAVICSGHPSTDVAFCFEHRDDSVMGQVSYDLLAGKLPAEGGPPLPKIAPVLITTSADLQNVRKFQVDLSRDGAYIVWSSRPTATGVETLRVQKLGETTSQQVAADVSQWQISPDGSQFFWLKSFNYNTTGAAAGILQAATFPGGAAPVTLVMNVADYDHAGNKGVIYREAVSNGVGALKVMADIANVAGVQQLDSGVLGIFDVATDGKTALYTKRGDVTGAFDMYAATTTAPRPCVLASQPLAAPLGSLLASGGGAVWARFDDTTDEALGIFTNVTTCTSRQFASNILRWSRVADEGYLYADDSPDGIEASLRYGKVTNGSLPAMGTSVQTRANPVFGSLLPSTAALVYTVDSMTAQNGLYVSVPLPFTTTTAPATDGGPATDSGPASDGAAPDAGAPDDAAGN